MEVPLLGLRADRVNALDIGGGTESGHGQRLRLASGEESGAVGARQNADLHGDGPDLVYAAAVHADPLVEDHVADGLLLDELEQTLADADLAASRFEQAGRILAFLAVGADRDGDTVHQVLDAVREVLRELGQDGSGRLGVGQAAVSGLDGDAEELGDVAQLVGLEVRVALAGDHECVEVTALDELPVLTQGHVQEADVEAHVVAHDRGAGDESEQLLGRFLCHRSAGDFGVGDAVHLCAEDVAARVHERGEAIDDLAVADANGADLDQVRDFGIAAGRLGVDDDELGAAFADLLDELQDGAGAGLEEAQNLGLADGSPHLFLDVDERLEGAVAEEDGIGHDVFGHDRSAGLDHHDGVARSGNDEVDVGALEIADRGIDHELAVDATDADGADWPKERDRTDRQSARGGKRAEDVGLVLLVRR